MRRALHGQGEVGLQGRRTGGRRTCLRAGAALAGKVGHGVGPGAGVGHRARMQQHEVVCRRQARGGASARAGDARPRGMTMPAVGKAPHTARAAAPPRGRLTKLGGDVAVWPA